MGRNIAEIYSKILFEQALEKKSLDKIMQDLSFMTDLIKLSPVIAEFLKSPIHEIHEKVKILKLLSKEAKLNELSVNFLEALISNKRTMALSNICDELSELKLSASGITLANLTSAREMSEKDIEKTKMIFEKKLAKKFAIKHNIDPSIVGGFTLQFGSSMYDASVAGAIDRLTRLTE